jgi:hypothetical protein
MPARPSGNVVWRGGKTIGSEEGTGEKWKKEIS